MSSYTVAAQTLKGNLSGLGLNVGGWAAWVVAVLPNALAGAPPLGSDFPLMIPIVGMVVGNLYFSWRYR